MSGRVRLSVPAFSADDVVDSTNSTNSSLPSDSPTPEAAPPEQSIAIREILGFYPRLLADLPLSAALLCGRAHGAGHFLLTTSRVALGAAQAAQVPAFVGGEISALALAAEHERANPAALEAWCARKLAEPEWRLTPVLALDLPHEPSLFSPRGWPFGRVLRAFGAELVAVGCGDRVPL